MPDPAEDIEAAEVYAEENLDGDEALVYLSGGDGVVEDQPADEHKAPHVHAAVEAEPEPVAAEPEPQPENAPGEPEPEPEKPKKSSRRAALDRRMIKLFGAADVAEDNTDDQVIVCRFIVGRDNFQTVDELTDVEVGQVCDQLYQWQQAKTLGDKVTDVLNNATLALESE